MKIYHISENPDIKVFYPRPSPSEFDVVRGDVVFGISEKLLHNYLLPRDCPRVCFFISEKTTEADKLKFFGNTDAGFVVVLESKWIDSILNTKIYCYELESSGFFLLDANAGYFASYKTTYPLSVRLIDNPLGEILRRNVEVRLVPSLRKITEEVKHSTLGFSLIRMRNAMP